MERMLQVEDVSKVYQLGMLNSESLKHKLQQWWNRAVQKKSPHYSPEQEDTNKYIWALRDISFDVHEGDVLGFVGNNGAGKSTLLKVLSRITKPTSGNIKGKGRIASLLEVGTGFHGELSGRENIYLNGQILGMKKAEIDNKLDEIIDFSGVERFLDTPVKRYSSGMYVRLAFAVASHLDAEILIVDEALAVGDEAFQRKCLSKMREISSQKGKTVLLVSHYLQALKSLCNKAIYLENGQIADMGKPEKVLANYLKGEKIQYLCQEYDAPENAPGNENIKIKRAEVAPQYIRADEVIDIRTPLDVNFEFWYNNANAGDLTVGVHLFTLSGDFVFDVCSKGSRLKNGLIKGTCQIPGDFLNDGSYYISIVFVSNALQRLYYFEACLSFDVEDYREGIKWQGKWPGLVRPKFDVALEQDSNLINSGNHVQIVQRSASAA